MGDVTLGWVAEMTELRSAVDTAVLGQLRESVGDDPEFLAELVDEFLQDAPTQLETLREAATSGDARAAMRAAHTLKGNGRTFGATQLASICQEAETAAGEGNLEAVRSRLDAIEDEWDRVGAELIVLRDGQA
jgi:HPt (histidine-containing phosphotransfer) domain-containing protein